MNAAATGQGTTAINLLLTADHTLTKTIWASRQSQHKTQAGPTMLLNQHFAELLETIGQSEANRYNYTRRLESFLQLHGERELADIGPGDVNTWLAMLKSRGYADTTLTGYRQAIKTLFNSAVNQGRLLFSPARHIKTGSTISQRPKLPAEASVTAITYQAIRWLEGDDPYRVRTGAFWLLSRAAGPRWGELHELKLSEVAAAIGAGRLLVRSFGKTGEVVLRFNVQTSEALTKWLKLRPREARIDCCFVGVRPTVTKLDRMPRYRPLSRSGATKALIDLAKKAGVSKAVLTHALRHRLGDSLTYQSPKLAAIALNHKDWQTAKTAIAYYHHPDESQVAAAIAELAEVAELGEWGRFFGVGQGDNNSI